MKYLQPSSLSLNLSETSILMLSSESKVIACLAACNLFINYIFIKFQCLFTHLLYNKDYFFIYFLMHNNLFDIALIYNLFDIALIFLLN